MKGKRGPRRARIAWLRSDGGYATVAAAGIIVAVVALLLVVVAIAGRVSARHHAQVAADLSAVAGAYAHFRGEDACARAAEVAGANDAALAHCRVDGRDVVATALVRGRDASARAGPVG